MNLSSRSQACNAQGIRCVLLLIIFAIMNLLDISEKLKSFNCESFHKPENFTRGWFLMQIY